MVANNPRTISIRFDCLMYVRLHKDTVADWRLDSRAHPCIHIGSGEVVGHKSVMGYTIDFSNNGHIGGVVHSTQFWVDPTLFPYSKAGEGRVTALSFGKYFLGKEEFEQEVPTPPEYEKWIIDARADDGSVSDDHCAEEQIAAQKVFREISKYKCRQVMDGQIVGRDVFETFAPVIDFTSVLCLICFWL
jgi:hypothetical protein